MHDGLVFIAIMTAVVLQGILGVLIIVPVLASARIVGHYILAKISDTDPFPDTIASPIPQPDPRGSEIRRETKSAETREDETT